MPVTTRLCRSNRCALVFLFPCGIHLGKPDVHHNVSLQVFLLVLVVKLQLEKGLSESDQLVFDPLRDRILVGMVDRDNELIVAVELEEDRKDLEPVIHDRVFDRAVMPQAEGQLNLRRTCVGKRNGQRCRSAVKSPHIESLSFPAHDLFDVLEDIHLRERLEAWQQDRMDAIRQSNETHESLFLASKSLGRFSSKRLDSFSGGGDLSAETLNERIH